jgi:hypothetical protein
MTGHYCTEHDPLLAAGFIRCAACGRTAYPADAEWAGGLLLANFPAPCEHTQPQAWLIDPDEMTTDADWCAAQATATGSPCRKRSRPGSSFCWHHDPARRGA